MFTERDLDLLLGRPIVVNRALISLTGDHIAAIMLGQAFYWTRKVQQKQEDREGWFWKTQEEWFEETGASRGQQERARKLLRSFEFWEEERRGVPAKMWFRVDGGKLATCLANLNAHNEPTGAREARRQDGLKCANYIRTKITSETTAGMAPISEGEEEYLRGK